MYMYYILIQKYMVSELEKVFSKNVLTVVWLWILNILAYVYILNLFFVYFRYLFKV